MVSDPADDEADTGADPDDRKDARRATTRAGATSDADGKAPWDVAAASAKEAGELLADSGVDTRTPADDVTWHALLEFCHTHIGKLDVEDREFRVEYRLEKDASGRLRRPDLPPAFAAFLDERTRFGVKVGLDNIRALLGRLGLDRMKVPTIVVGGTNGKGTVATALGDGLGRVRYRPGVYTSPHVERFMERIQVSGGDPDLRALEAACDRVQAATEALDQEGVHPTYFEVATALALETFRRHDARPLVLEVGMGGRGDAVNALEPTATVITNIGTDHEEHLGPSLAERVYEKAGLMRPGVPCFTAAQGEALRLLKDEARRRGTPLVPVLPEAPQVEAEEADLALVRAVLGDHRLRKSLRMLRDLDPLSLRLPRLPGRRESVRLESGAEIVLDVAHNPEALADLGRHVDGSEVPVGRRVLLTAQLTDKDPTALAGLARDRFGAVHLTRPEGPRARPAADLAAAFEEAGVPVARIDDETDRAFAHAFAVTPPGGLLVVAGSFYLISVVRPLVRQVTPHVP